MPGEHLVVNPARSGFTWDNPVSRLYRDGRLLSIGGGADEVMRSIIAKKMGTLPKRDG